jgi:hypothetical protein
MPIINERNIPQEQPPANPEDLPEWLARMMTLINGAFDSTSIMDIAGQLPTNPTDGMIKYFPNPILPDIEYPGPWVYTDGVWRSMTSRLWLIYRGNHVPDQIPLGLNIPLQLLFGPGGVSTDDSITIGANGDIIFNRDANLDITLIIHYKRTNNNLKCYLIFDSVFNGIRSTNSVIRSINTTGEPEGFELTLPVQGVAGDVLQFFLTRDSLGADDGYLHTFPPTLPELGAGHGVAIRIVRDV